MDKRDFTIGVLAITAAILFVGLMVVHQSAPIAQAGEVSAYGGDYTVSVGKFTRDTDLLYVIDNSTERLLVYNINRRTGAIAIADKAELSLNRQSR